MNRKKLSRFAAPAAAILLSLGTLASASTVTQTIDIMDGDTSATSISTAASNQTIHIPLSDVGGSVPANLTLVSNNLPRGVSLTLNAVSESGSDLVLNVSVAFGPDAPSQLQVDALANVALISGGTTLTVFQVPVESPIVQYPSQNPVIHAAFDN